MKIIKWKKSEGTATQMGDHAYIHYFTKTKTFDFAINFIILSPSKTKISYAGWRRDSDDAIYEKEFTKNKSLNDCVSMFCKFELDLTNKCKEKLQEELEECNKLSQRCLVLI